MSSGRRAVLAREVATAAAARTAVRRRALFLLGKSKSRILSFAL